MTDPMTAERVRGLIAAGLPDANIAVLGDDGRHFEALVVSPAFAGMSQVKRHQMVYAALGDAMREAIHALSLVTETPEERAARG